MTNYCIVLRERAFSLGQGQKPAGQSEKLILAAVCGEIVGTTFSLAQERRGPPSNN